MTIELMVILFFVILCLMNIVLLNYSARIKYLEDEIRLMKYKINELTKEDTYKELIIKPVKPSNSGTTKML